MEKLKCRHLPCSCEVNEPERFCSTSCHDAETAPEQTTHPPEKHCSCGHEHCSAEAEELNEAEGLQIASAALAQS